MNRITTTLVALLMSTAAVQAQELRLATTAPENSPWGAWLSSVAERASELSDGELTLSIYYGGQLGDEQATMGLLARGRVDIASVTTNAGATLEPGLEAIHIPFAWDSDAQFDCAVDAHLLPLIDSMLTDRGIVTLSSFEIPPYVLFSRETTILPGDLSGQRWRAVPTRVSVGFLNAMGANAVPLGNPDMVTSLQTGAVAGAETSGLFGIALGIHQVAPNILMTQHTRVVGALFVTQSTLDRLSETSLAALTEAARENASIRESARSVERSMIEAVAAEGVNVFELDDAARAAWSDAATAALPALLEEIGGRADEVWAGVQAARQACGA